MDTSHNSKSFVSFDAADGLGIRAQVIVKTGTLPIKSVQDGDKTAKVIFDESAAGLEFPVTANVIKGTPVHEVAVAAAGTGREVAYRIETRRKADIDRRKAFPPAKDADRKDDVEYLSTSGKSGNEVVAALVGLDAAANDEMVTDPSEDRRWASVPRAQAPAFVEATASPVTTTTAAVDVDAIMAALVAAKQAGAPQGVVDVLTADALKAGVPAAKALTAGATGDTGSDRPAARRAHAVEGKRWDEFNGDGRPNLGSYQVSGVLALQDWAFSLVREAPLFVDRPAGEAEEAAAFFAGHLADITDHVQVGAYGGGRPNRGVTSWFVARMAVQSGVERHFPLPTSKSDDYATQLAQWKHAVKQYGITRLLSAVTTLYGSTDGMGEVSTASTASATNPTSGSADMITDSVAAEAPGGGVNDDTVVTAPPAATPDDTVDGQTRTDVATDSAAVVEAPQAAVTSDTFPAAGDIADADDSADTLIIEPEPAPPAAPSHDDLRDRLLGQLSLMCADGGLDTSAPGNALEQYVAQQYRATLSDLDTGVLERMVQYAAEQGSEVFVRFITGHVAA